MEEKDECAGCGAKVEFDYARAKDINAGDILITTKVWYCPECLYMDRYEVNISK